VKDAVVVVVEGQAPGTQLVAYVSTREHAEIGKAQLRGYLRARLPDYMVPADYLMLDAMPLTANGKIDRRALPEPRPEAEAERRAFALPQSTTEEVLLGIWQGLLATERISVHDNFFALGGHSLLATQMISKVREALLAEVPVRKLFESPTLSGFARQVELAQVRGGAASAPALRRAERQPR